MAVICLNQLILLVHVQKNEYRYRFDIQVIPTVQGADAAADIRQTRKIEILDDLTR